MCLIHLPADLEDQAAELEVTLNEQATLASVQALLRNITFTASAPVDTPCTVRFQLIAPDGRMTSNLAERKITSPAIATDEEESESGPEALSAE